MTALEIAAIEHLLAVCQRVHAEWGGLGDDDAGISWLLTELSDAQSDIEDLLVSQ